MNETNIMFIQGSVVEEEVHMTMVEFCHACSAEEEHVMAWIFEGVLEPVGELPRDWRFSGESLRRARAAVRLSRDLELNPHGVALVLDLLDEIAALRSRLQRSGTR